MKKQYEKGCLERKQSERMGEVIAIARSIIEKSDGMLFKNFLSDVMESAKCCKNYAEFGIRKLFADGWIVRSGPKNGIYTFCHEPIPVDKSIRHAKKKPVSKRKIQVHDITAYDRIKIIRRDAKECAPPKINPDMWTSISQVHS